MNVPASRSTIAAAAAVALAGAAVAEWPKTVHAYRRQPHMRINDRTGLAEERPVEVVCCGEKIMFLSNDAGHIVAQVHGEEAYNRLVKEIPEAYIPYSAGENIPTERVLAAEHKGENVTRPAGNFVLESQDAQGKPVYKVLDDLSDTELRTFGESVGMGAEQLPDVLTGETLVRAIFNLMGGSAA